MGGTENELHRPQISTIVRSQPEFVLEPGHEGRRNCVSPELYQLLEPWLRPLDLPDTGLYSTGDVFGRQALHVQSHSEGVIDARQANEAGPGNLVGWVVSRARHTSLSPDLRQAL